MTGVSHEVKVKLALLQIVEVLRSSTKDHGATVSLAVLWKYRNIGEGN